MAFSAFTLGPLLPFKSANTPCHRFHFVFKTTFSKSSKPSPTKRARNRPFCFSFQLARSLRHRNLPQRWFHQTLGVLLRGEPAVGQCRAASLSVVPASWPFLRTAPAIVSSLLGKTVAHSDAVIKVHYRNEGEESIKYQSLDVQLTASLRT